MPDSERNFARYTRRYWNDHPEEQESIVQEHVARIEQGVDVWNDVDQAFAAYLEENGIDDGFYIFRGAKLDRISFGEATFSAHAYFSYATFSDDAYFSDATFSDDAYFRGATFEGDAYFRGATFEGDAFFSRATFESICSFNQSTSTKFVPNFLAVKYKTAPLIEGFKIHWVKDRPETNIEKYRQLKKIAIEGANHEQEVRFFAFETRCKMYLEYPAILTKLSIGLYWIFSNFGQSLLRPLGALVLVWIVAAAMTISTTMKSPIPETLVSLIMFEHLEPCEAISSNAFRSKLDAIRSQSIGSSLTLPVIAMDRHTQHQRNQCLYGQGGGVPETNRIINGIQQVLSLIFLFLFGLAVRNRFKIK